VGAEAAVPVAARIAESLRLDPVEGRRPVSGTIDRERTRYLPRRHRPGPLDGPRGTGYAGYVRHSGRSRLPVLLPLTDRLALPTLGAVGILVIATLLRRGDGRSHQRYRGDSTKKALHFRFSSCCENAHARMHTFRERHCSRGERRLSRSVPLGR
jgi:hypothetical protein